MRRPWVLSLKLIDYIERESTLLDFTLDRTARQIASQLTENDCLSEFDFDATTFSLIRLDVSDESLL